MGAATSVISTHGLTTLRTNVTSSISLLNEYQSDPDATTIKASYNTLLTNINSSIRDTSGASVNTIASVQSTYNSDVVRLDQKRDALISRIKGYTANDVLRQVSYGVCMFFAAIILTNHMVGEKWYIQVFYMIWAMIFYPLVLLYGLYDPPVWHAIFPLIEKNKLIPSWLVTFTIILYSPLNVVSDGNTGQISKNILRLFTAAAIVFIFLMHLLPQLA